MRWKKLTAMLLNLALMLSLAPAALAYGDVCDLSVAVYHNDEAAGVYGDTYGTVSGGGAYVEGSAVTLTAAPKTGYRFGYWGQNGLARSVSGDLSYTATAYETGTYDAHFWDMPTAEERAEPQLSVGLYRASGFPAVWSADALGMEAVEGYTEDAFALGGSALHPYYGELYRLIKMSNGGTASWTLRSGKQPALTLEGKDANCFELTVYSNPGPLSAGKTDVTVGWLHPVVGLAVGTYEAELVYHDPDGLMTAVVSAPVRFTVTEPQTADEFTVRAASDYGTVTANKAGDLAEGVVYAKGATVQLTAKAADANRQTFAGWFLDNKLVSTSNPYSFKASKDVSLTAVFTRSRYQITVDAVSGTAAGSTDGGTVSGGGWYNAGDQVKVTATPKLGYEFIGWHDFGNSKVVSTSAAYTLTLSGGNPDHCLEAYFKPVYSLSGGKVTAKKGAVLIFAQYKNGKMTAVKSVTLAADCTDADAAALLGRALPAAGYKLMLVNGATYAPLCNAWSG